jgi:predicted DNA-binding protein
MPAGRPRGAPSSTLSIYVAFRLPPLLHERISSLAKREGNPIASTLRRLLTEALRVEEARDTPRSAER